ncbi:heme biosynthesis protein HemY [Xanthobacter tagetidis]|uniref:Heme biosynthesis protein HemY n=1 Tax=Xanthobacter tagetidis TaxID=60216 RepID=A0A3L7A8F8_9HYPH|nr:heme biosynthesis HemY N-terminal domain-containing protein [Xanthobacter tagetidis]MBB6309381.1 HemY protein [Xanthobacter tagetidis]RLP76686.1 heme biosynthesis protein HemY [Xanthobacter tagetidis]
MIRLVILLVVLAALAFGIGWLADRPGEIHLAWEGWRVETTVPVALAALAVLTAALMGLWRVLSLLLRSPQMMARHSRRRRRDKGWDAVTRGLLAIGTGDVAAARQARTDAARLLPNEPLTRLLTAQTAQFDGHREAAVAEFHAMAERSETRLLGLRGLHMEARRAGDQRAAAVIAEEAAAAAPALAWAVDAVIEARCAAGDFPGARAVLERQMAQKGIDKTQYRRRRAVLLAAEAVALEHTDPLVARERATEAVRLAPTLVPAAACAGRLLGAAGELKKAAKIVETAFAANPHPELAEVEAHLRPGDAALDRLKRIRVLANKAPSARESAIALARAAIDAQEFKHARLVLEPLLADPSQRVCLLMAELEAAEHADIGKAREWTARAVRANRDPAWIADGVVSDHWAPVSPISGKLDAFVWAVPPGVSATPILEHEAERVKAAIAAVRASEEAKAAALAADAEAQARAQAEAQAQAQAEAQAAQAAEASVVAAAPPPSDTPPAPSAAAAPSAPLVAPAPAKAPDRVVPAALSAPRPDAVAAPVPPVGGEAAGNDAKGEPEPAAGFAAKPAEQAPETAAPPARGDDMDRVVRLPPPGASLGTAFGGPGGAGRAPGARTPRAETIVAMPPLPDDPGPEPDGPEPDGHRPRFLGL